MLSRTSVFGVLAAWLLVACSGDAAKDSRNSAPDGGRTLASNTGGSGAGQRHPDAGSSSGGAGGASEQAGAGNSSNGASDASEPDGRGGVGGSQLPGGGGLAGSGGNGTSTEAGAGGEPPGDAGNHCNDLLVGDATIHTALVDHASPIPAGGGIPSGIYDMVEQDIYVDIEADAGDCRGLADSDLKFRQDHISVRFTATADGRVTFEEVISAPEMSSILRTSTSVRIESAGVFDREASIPLCEYISTPAGETSTIQMEDASEEHFSLVADTLTLFEPASTDSAGDVFCTRVYTLKPRR